MHAPEVGLRKQGRMMGWQGIMFAKNQAEKLECQAAVSQETIEEMP
jgi:hypothetical protein